jgi:hypothetical protein
MRVAYWRGNAILLAGAALWTGLSISRLPPPGEIFRLPATPVDRTRSAGGAVPVYLFLTHAAAAVPRGATATVVAEPRNAAMESVLHSAAVALLPGRRVFPAAQWDAFTPGYEAQAQYVLVFGATPATPPGELVLAVSGGSGSVWRREVR